jgi:hypothetical protein
VDFEYRFWDLFNEKSRIKPLTNMDYENFVFFQFMGNRIGPDGVIFILGGMPTSLGREAQLAALAAVPGMEDTFEEFVRAILDRTLKDSSGTTIDRPLRPTEGFSFTSITSKVLTSYPFVFSRYRISFDSEKSFAVEARSEGAGRSAWRARDAVGAWGPTPATAIGGCNDISYILYAITTTPAGVRTESIATTMVTEAPCDECLIGRWEATNGSIFSYMQSVIAMGGDNTPTLEAITGNMFLEFKENGTGSGGYENLNVYETGVGGNVGTDAIYIFKGSSGGPYTADGTELIGLSGQLICR